MTQQNKGGRNDLKRWKEFGGTLTRPAPPTPTRRPEMTETLQKQLDKADALVNALCDALHASRMQIDSVGGYHRVPLDHVEKVEMALAVYNSQRTGACTTKP